MPYAVFQQERRHECRNITMHCNLVIIKDSAAFETCLSWRRSLELLMQSFEYMRHAGADRAVLQTHTSLLLLAAEILALASSVYPTTWAHTSCKTIWAWTGSASSAGLRFERTMPAAKARRHQA